MIEQLEEMMAELPELDLSPATSGPAGAAKETEFMFIIGDSIIGRVVADCCNCAWRTGHPRWPAAEMAHTIEGPKTLQSCIIEHNRRNREQSKTWASRN